MTKSLISPENTWVLFAILTGIVALSIYLEQEYKWANKITGSVIALIIAMTLSNLKVIPLEAVAYDIVWDYIVPLSIPLLLYHANIKRIFKESGRLLLIYMISGLGTVLGAIIAFFLFRNRIPEAYKVSAMMTGSYTGGGLNFVAMSKDFKVGGDLVSATVVADNLLMALYFFFLMAASGMNFFLDRFKHPIIDEMDKKGRESTGKKTRAAEFWTAKNISLKDIAFSIGIAFAIVAVSMELSSLFKSIIPTGNLFLNLINGLLGNPFLIMTTVTMVLASVFEEFFTGLNGAQEIGSYLIYIFFAVIGIPASIPLIITKSPILLLFCGLIVLVNMLVTFGFGKLLKFNLEDMIIASNANIGGPSTAAAMAIAKGWEVLIVPSVLVGTLGYVIGNYYGILVGNILQMF